MNLKTVFALSMFVVFFTACSSNKGSSGNTLQKIKDKDKQEKTVDKSRGSTEKFAPVIAVFKDGSKTIDERLAIMKEHNPQAFIAWVYFQAIEDDDELPNMISKKLLKDAQSEPEKVWQFFVDTEKGFCKNAKILFTTEELVTYYRYLNQFDRYLSGRDINPENKSVFLTYDRVNTLFSAAECTKLHSEHLETQIQHVLPIPQFINIYGALLSRFQLSTLSIKNAQRIGRSFIWLLDESKKFEGKDKEALDLAMIDVLSKMIIPMLTVGYVEHEYRLSRVHKRLSDYEDATPDHKVSYTILRLFHVSKSVLRAFNLLMDYVSGSDYAAQAKSVDAFKTFMVSEDIYAAFLILMGRHITEVKESELPRLKLKFEHVLKYTPFALGALSEIFDTKLVSISEFKKELHWKHEKLHAHRDWAAALLKPWFKEKEETSDRELTVLADIASKILALSKREEHVKLARQFFTQGFSKVDFLDKKFKEKYSKLLNALFAISVCPNGGWDAVAEKYRKEAVLAPALISSQYYLNAVKKYLESKDVHTTKFSCYFDSLNYISKDLDVDVKPIFNYLKTYLTARKDSHAIYGDYKIASTFETIAKRKEYALPVVTFLAQEAFSGTYENLPKEAGESLVDLYHKLSDIDLTPYHEVTHALLTRMNGDKRESGDSLLFKRYSKYTHALFADSIHIWLKKKPKNQWFAIIKSFTASEFKGNVLPYLAAHLDSGSLATWKQQKQVLMWINSGYGDVLYVKGSTLHKSKSGIIEAYVTKIVGKLKGNKKPEGGYYGGDIKSYYHDAITFIRILWIIDKAETNKQLKAKGQEEIIGLIK